MHLRIGEEVEVLHRSSTCDPGGANQAAVQDGRHPQERMVWADCYPSSACGLGTGSFRHPRDAKLPVR